MLMWRIERTWESGTVPKPSDISLPLVTYAELGKMFRSGPLPRTTSCPENSFPRNGATLSRRRFIRTYGRAAGPYPHKKLSSGSSASPLGLAK